MAATTRSLSTAICNGRILNIVGAGTDVRLQQVTLAHGLVGDEENGGAILLGGAA